MTELYEKLDILIKYMWEDTPWMIRHYTDTLDSVRYEAIYDWLSDWYGRGRCPIGRNPGIWMMGSATIGGQTWIGFAAEKDMKTFLEVWK